MYSIFKLLFIAFLLNGQATGDWLKHFGKIRPPTAIDPINEPLQKLLPYEEVPFTVANTSKNYESSVDVVNDGMTQLYFLTQKFIDFIQKDDALPEGMLYLSDEGVILLDDVGQQLPRVFHHFGPMLIVVLLAILFSIIMPIVGIMICCCRCADQCGARRDPFDKRFDPYRRYGYGIMLTGVAVLICFGVVCAFTTNEYLEDGITTLPNHVRTSIKDIDLYIDNSEQELNTLLITNFGELEKTLSNMLEASGKVVLEKLGQVSKASVLVNLTTIVDGLSVIKKDLNKSDILTRSLQENALQLEIALKETKDSLISKFNQCRSYQPCQDFLKKYNLRQLSLEANFTQLPNVTAGLRNLSELTADNIEQEVAKGRKEFEKVQKYVQDTVTNDIPPIKENIYKTGEAIKMGAIRIKQILDRLRRALKQNTHRYINEGELYITQYSAYRYYICLGISFVLLIVLISLCLALLCGFCGSRPNNGYQDDCCNKGTGGRYLLLGIWIMFMTCSILMIVAISYFVTGVMADKAVCEPLIYQRGGRIMELLEEVVDINQYYTGYHGQIMKEKMTLSRILKSCHQNKSMYEVLDLKSYMDISDIGTYSEQFGVQSRLDDLTHHIRLDHDVNILTDKARQLLLQLADSSLNDIDFAAYTNVLGEKITSIDLVQLSNAINETARQLPSNLVDIKHSLLNQALYLQTHQDTHVSTMNSLARQLEITARQMQEHLKFNQTSLKIAIYLLLTDVNEAQGFIEREGRTVIKQLAKEFGNEFMTRLNDYVKKVTTEVTDGIGKCWPVSHAYNATLVAGCNRILDPYNGFWMSVGSTVILFVPAIILSFVLINLYRKSDPYPGPLAEEEYLNDCYRGDRENIPLAKPPDNKTKRVYRQVEDGHNGTPNRTANERLTQGHPRTVGHSVMPSTSSAATATSPDLKLTDFRQQWQPSSRCVVPTSRTGLPNGQDYPEYERPPPYNYIGQELTANSNFGNA